MQARAKLYNTCVLPVLTYGIETMTFTKRIMQKFKTTQRAMERKMMGISLKDKVPNKKIREVTRVADVAEKATRLKWRWAGHVVRSVDEKWSKRILDWRPRLGRRSVGRPQARWVDDIVKTEGRKWKRTAQDRETWKVKEEDYIQEWIKEI